MTQRVCEGEIYHLRRRLDTGMTEEEYLTMAGMKTASLFATCAGLSAALSGGGREQRRALEEFGEAFGTAFQIVDDCLDLAGPPGDKDRLKDIEGGRVTLPLIKALASLEAPERARLADAFRCGDVPFCREAILGSGAVTASMDAARSLMAAARRSLSALPDSPARASLAGLTDFILGSDLHY